MKSTTFCPLCKSAKTSLYCEKCANTGTYLACSRCGLVYVSKLAPTDELYKSYSGGWFKAIRRNLFARFRNFESYGDFNDFMKKADSITGLVERRIGKAHLSSGKKVRLLDIGCNKGFLLHSAIQRGWETHGIELVPELLIPFRKKHRHLDGKLFTGRFDDVHKRLRRGYFDVVTAIDVIEHFESPRKNLERIYSILRPGGLFIVQTPDAGCRSAKMEGKEWGALKPMEHLFLFNKKNYKSIMDDIGFTKTEFMSPFEESDGNFVAVSRK